MRATLPLHHLLLFLLFLHPTQSQGPPNGYTCSTDRTIYPCRTYAVYRATPPNLLDLAPISDLFGVSRTMISDPSNIAFPNATLVPDQLLLVPLTCSCTSNHSYSNTSYKILPGDTFYILSTTKFQNLTTYQDIELVNSTLVPTNLSIGADVVVPVFCQCPEKSLTSRGVSHLLTYQLRPSDTNASMVASRFRADLRTMVSINARKLVPFSTVLIPVTRIPTLPGTNNSGSSSPTASGGGSGKDGVVVGLSIGLGVVGIVLLVGLLWLLCFFGRRRGYGQEGSDVKRRRVGGVGRGCLSMLEENKFMADITDCLDRYRLYQIEELRRATSDFDPACVIQGSVYKGFIDGEAIAVKKMKWNAYQELRILQKVNHTNLVKLEGFCIDPEDGTCYLVYEYVENGSLSSWLQEPRKTSSNLDWKTRLRIAVDVANGLQYIHEHTWPKVVHKDIKSSNILLDSKMKAKIANFGLARSGCNAITTHIVGTQGYIALEYLADGLVTTKMDVFAYGVVLLELVLGREVMGEKGEMLWAEAERVEREEEVKAWMDKKLVEGECCPMESVMSVVGVARACVQRDLTRRPSMVDVVYTLSRADDACSDFSGDGLFGHGSGVFAR